MTDKLAIWNAVCETDPAHTKHVAQRGGFTAISANYQVMEATKQFGPVGIGWGYDCGEPIFHDNLVMIPVTFWHGDRANRFGPIYGCEEWRDAKGRLDSDATKKAETDGLTKALSRLGFNADVFMGLYDDQKYVESMKRKFAEHAELPTGPLNDKTRDWVSGQLDKRQIPPGELCKAFEITSLKALNYEQLDEVKAWIRDHKKEAA